MEVYVFLKTVSVLVAVLLFVPAISGYAMSKEMGLIGIKRFYLSLPLGFAIENAMYTLICLPAKYLNYKIPVVTLVWWSLLMLITVVSYAFIRRDIMCALSRLNVHFIMALSRKWLKHNMVSILLILLILYQIMRVVLLMTTSYFDDKTYITLVTTILQTESLNNVEAANSKLFLTTWYQFEAGLAWLAEIHPLILCGSILKGVLIVYAYSVIACLSSVFFRKIQQQICFVFIWAVINESICRALSHDAFIFFYFTSWGKGLVALLWVPLVFYLFLYLHSKHFRISGGVSLCCVCISALSSSMAGIYILALVVPMLTVSTFVRTLHFRQLAYGAFTGLPILVQFYLYLCYTAK